jgi:hypothetical protein
METAKGPINKRMDKIIYSNNGILLRNERLNNKTLI